ncbi:MAG: hypothetical protein NTU49_01300 [Gammaproteobacteria bacterium]|nr:hypothetical protein [Gammaproteobacteria bacterium]
MKKYIIFSLVGTTLLWSGISSATNCACLHRGGWQGNNSYYRCETNSCSIESVPGAGAVWTVDNSVNLAKQGVNYVSQMDGKIACPKAYRHANPGIYARCQNNKAAAAIETERNGLPQCAFYKDWKSNGDGEYLCNLTAKSVVRCAYNSLTGLNISGDESKSLQLGCDSLQSNATPQDCASCYNPL